MFTNETIKRIITSTILGSLFWFVFFHLPPIAFSIVLFTILCTILLHEWKNLFQLNSFWFWFIMPWYPILPFIILMYMSHDPCYRTLVYYLFIIVFTFDSASYIIGNFIGTNQIIPNVSPKKTIEGCIGGFICALGVFYFTIIQENLNLSHLCSVIFIFIVCTIAFVGDAFESFLKRQANIKDSSSILPGHGGFLDRFDAVMFVAIFFFLFKNELATFLCIH